MAEFADVIIDITHEKVDRPFQYRIPGKLSEEIHVGCQVEVPFGKGNHIRTGYVVGLSDRAEYDPSRIKEIADICRNSVSAEAQLIQLAWWMKERYGCTMNQALKTVLPVKQQVRRQESRFIRCLISRKELEEAIAEASRKKYRARERLLKSFLETDVIPYEMAAGQLNLTRAAIKPLEEKGILVVDSQAVYRDPGSGFLGEKGKWEEDIRLNEEQQAAADGIISQYDQGIRKTYLLHGVTGSGKTEVYMELIRHVTGLGRQVILLIPEIALTYQTVLRFTKRFGSRVSFMNSRLSQGEKYDQFERAKKGEVQIMIGPRSALFTPFPDLGLIIIDEEHENAYKSEITPRYHAREAAEQRARLGGASLVLGSATPSVETYTKACRGIYGYFRIRKRAKKNSILPKVHIVDMRTELKEGNRSIFSRLLREQMEEKLEKGQQIMLFLNRRGYSRFLSCRSCGEAMKCPHCDVTLTLHQNGQLICHYCGYQVPRPKLCPVCGSPYLAPFGTGTQKIEAMAREAFPGARILRMDLDTTSKKGGHEAILSAFADHQADILIGTQMIVKGHDFPAVTLVGILAADLSLYAPDYRCGEKTFQLLTQAAGRAGRDEKAGQVVIQSYSPEHYCIQTAAAQDYDAFYAREMEYRRLLHYPPACVMMTLLIGSEREEAAGAAMERAAAEAKAFSEAELIGPVNAPVYKLNDIYRKILYMKSENYDILIKIRDQVEQVLEGSGLSRSVSTQFDIL